MLKIWNVSLVIMTFFLTIFGTFMTRSGVVQSVHSFGENRELAWLFTGFMTVLLISSFGLVIYRLPLLRARNAIDSWTSREASFLANNWVLLATKRRCAMNGDKRRGEDRDTQPAPTRPAAGRQQSSAER